MDDQVYYLSTTSPNPSRVSTVNALIQIVGATIYAGLPAVVYKDQYNNKITTNIACFTPGVVK